MLVKFYKLSIRFRRIFETLRLLNYTTLIEDLKPKFHYENISNSRIENLLHKLQV